MVRFAFSENRIRFHFYLNFALKTRKKKLLKTNQGKRDLKSIIGSALNYFLSFNIYSPWKIITMVNFHNI